MLCKGIFGVPLDVCAQSMYHAIKAVADKVSNLSLREIHLVNIDPEKTQFIQSVFLQFTSSDGRGSPLSENSQPKPLPVVTESQMPSPDGDKSQLSVRVKEEGHEEVTELHPENVQGSTRQSLPDGRNTPDVETLKDHSHLTDAAEGSHMPQEEKILDEEQGVTQETADVQWHHSSSDDPETMEVFGDTFTQEQNDFELHPENVQESTPQSLPNGRNTPDMETVEDCKHLTDAAEGSDMPQQEKILDEEQREGQETADVQCHYSSSDDPETMERFDDTFTQEQNDRVISELPLEQEHKKSHELPAADESLSTPNINSQILDVKVDDQEQKSLANSQPSMDYEDQKLNELPHTKRVLNSAENDNLTLEKDSETGEMASYEECHSMSSELKPQFEMCMQELNLEEYRESTPSSFFHELTTRLPLDLPEDVSQRPDDSGPRSLESDAQENSHGDQELFCSLPVNAVDHADHQ